MRLKTRWGIITSPKEILKENSGPKVIENIPIEDMESEIDELIAKAGRFYYENDRNKKILSRFSRYTFIAYSDKKIYSNNTGYSDNEVKQFLRKYDSKFKRPLKNLLINYYRLKHNPEIEMKGYMLEKLGFRPCNHCHGEDNRTVTANKLSGIFELNSRPANARADLTINPFKIYHLEQMSM